MSEESGSSQVWQALAAVAAVGAALLVKRQLEDKRAKSTEPSARHRMFPADGSIPHPASPPSHLEPRHDSSLPSPEQAKALYLEARAAAERGDVATAEQQYHVVARLYDVMNQNPSVASFSLAASLYQLGLYATARGETRNGMNELHKAAEVFRAVAQTAEARGATDLARRAHYEARAADALVNDLVTRRAQQEDFIRSVDQKGIEAATEWARGLGRI